MFMAFKNVWKEKTFTAFAIDCKTLVIGKKTVDKSRKYNKI